MCWHDVISGCPLLSLLILRNVFSLNSGLVFLSVSLLFSYYLSPDSLTASLIFYQMPWRVFSLRPRLIMYLFNLLSICPSLRWSLVFHRALSAFNCLCKFFFFFNCSDSILSCLWKNIYILVQFVCCFQLIHTNTVNILVFHDICALQLLHGHRKIVVMANKVWFWYGSC